jgi:DNA-3-methyladenine glycosylase II
MTRNEKHRPLPPKGRLRSSSSAPSEPDDARQYELGPLSEELRNALAMLYEIAPHFRVIERTAGPLLVKQWPANFRSLIRVIVGQQLSTKAAAAIYGRLDSALSIEPLSLLSAPGHVLVDAGLSKAKITSCLALARAIETGSLNLRALTKLDDQEAKAQLINVKGIGPWTADIFLLFCLGRLNTWPHSDLGLQSGYQILLSLDTRPDARHFFEIGQSLHPVRGAAAHLLWHYYRHIKSPGAPLAK